MLHLPRRPNGGQPEDLACHEEGLGWLAESAGVMSGVPLPPLAARVEESFSPSSMCADTGDLCCDEDIDGLEAPALASQSSSIASSSSAFAVFHPLPVAPPPLIGRSHSMVESSSAMPPAPAGLRRSSSVGSTAGLSSLYRDSTGRFYSAQQLHRRVDERGLAELAEVVGNMHRQDRALYALPHDYLAWLQDQTLLLAWRRGAVSWFSKVVEHFKANREIIWTALNFLDRSLSSSGPSTRPPPEALAAADFEHLALCALLLACKIHEGAPLLTSTQLGPLSSVPVTAKALCELELDMIRVLDCLLHPPTPGSFVHHLLTFLPHHDARSLLALDEHANDLALLALQDESFLRFSVSSIALGAVLASIWEVLDPQQTCDSGVAGRWLQALAQHGVPVCMKEVDAVLAELRRLLTIAAEQQAAEALGGMHMDVHMDVDVVGDVLPPGVAGLCWGPLAGLYLPDFLASAQAAIPEEEADEEDEDEEDYEDEELAMIMGDQPCGRPRALSPTGVDEIFMLEHHQQPAAAKRKVVVPQHLASMGSAAKVRFTPVPLAEHGHAFFA